MTNEVKGYKAFNVDMTNGYNVTFEEGKKYTVEGPIIFGNCGNGYHFCERLEDTFRYFPALKKEIKIAEVTGLDEVVEYSDEYYGYYNMYVVRTLLINKILTREEIIEKILTLSEHNVLRFVKGFKLTEAEKELFRILYAKNIKINLAISYYQDGDLEAYEKHYRKIKTKSYYK